MENRTMDAKLAQAFGWELDCLPEQILNGKHRSPEGRMECVPYYSSTWEGVGLVVEAMEAKGFDLFVMSMHQDDFQDRVVSCGIAVEFRQRGAKMVTPYSHSGRKPWAFALAALRALGEEVD